MPKADSRVNTPKSNPKSAEQFDEGHDQPEGPGQQHGKHTEIIDRVHRVAFDIDQLAAGRQDKETCQDETEYQNDRPVGGKGLIQPDLSCDMATVLFMTLSPILFFIADQSPPHLLFCGLPLRCLLQNGRMSIAIDQACGTDLTTEPQRAQRKPFNCKGQISPPRHSEHRVFCRGGAEERRFAGDRYPCFARFSPRSHRENHSTAKQISPHSHRERRVFCRGGAEEHAQPGKDTLAPPDFHRRATESAEKTCDPRRNKCAKVICRNVSPEQHPITCHAELSEASLTSPPPSSALSGTYRSAFQGLPHPCKVRKGSA